MLAGLEALLLSELKAKQLQYLFLGCGPTLVVQTDRGKLIQLVLNPLFQRR